MADIDRKIHKRLIDKGLLDLEDLRQKGIVNDEIIEMMMNEILDEEDHVEQHKEARAEKEFGKYKNLRLLGRGGMGEVYAAFDSSLQRNVALKFLRLDDREHAERFLRESRAQAKIDHPGICKIFDTGEQDGKLFIEMQFISGGTLDRVAKDLDLEKKLRLIKQVADALHEAHKQGVIHRDIKPGNIMVEEKDGDFFPYVVDFGLAREISGSTLTLTQVAIGTPLYMSPEQAAGNAKSVDRRSDIYSLGVTLYQLISGYFPFESDNPAVLLIQIISSEPIRLRERIHGIPSDVETIVMKCLEKDPARRYESAKALAADVERYLDGEPIMARPASLVYRVRRKAQKHPKIVVASAFAVVTIIVLSAFWLQTYLHGQRQAASAQRFGEKISRVESAMRLAYMSPLHDISPQRTKALAMIEQMQRETDSPNHFAWASARYAAGRGYLILEEYEKARTEFEQAWKLGYTEPENSYSLAIVYGKLYSRKLLDVAYARKETERASILADAENNYRIPALRHMKQATGVALDAPAFPQALMAFYEGNFDQVFPKAQESLRQTPWFYEALLLQSESYLAQSTQLIERGQHDQAQEKLLLSRLSAEGAARVAESDPKIYEAEAAALLMKMKSFLDQGKDPSAELDSIQQAGENALKADPQNVPARRILSEAYITVGRFRYHHHGENPSEWLNKAVNVSNVRPAPPELLNAQGTAQLIMADYELFHMMDPARSIDSAIALLEQSLNARESPVVRNDLSNAWMIRAENMASRNQDPSNAYRQAAKAMAPIQSEENAENQNTMGTIYLSWGLYDAEQGKEPRALLKQAIEHYKLALKINPRQIAVLSNLGAAYLSIASYEIEIKESPGTSFDLAEKAFLEAQKLGGNLAEISNNLGVLYSERLRYAVEKKESPDADFAKASEYLGNALSVDPDDPLALEELGNVNYSMCKASGIARYCAVAKQFYTKSGTAGSLLGLARIEMDNRAFAKAEALLKKAEENGASPLKTARLRSQLK